MNTVLIDRLCEQILKHPEHFDIDAWYYFDTEKDYKFWKVMADFKPKEEVTIPKNFCGTTGCIAGLTVWLEAPNGELKVSREDYGCCVEVEGKKLSVFERAAELLQITNGQASLLFHLKNWPAGFRRQYQIHQDSPTEKAKVAGRRLLYFKETGK